MTTKVDRLGVGLDVGTKPPGEWERRHFEEQLEALRNFLGPTGTIAEEWYGILVRDAPVITGAGPERDYKIVGLAREAAERLFGTVVRVVGADSTAAVGHVRPELTLEGPNRTGKTTLADGLMRMAGRVPDMEEELAEPPNIGLSQMCEIFGCAQYIEGGNIGNMALPGLRTPTIRELIKGQRGLPLQGRVESREVLLSHPALRAFVLAFAAIAFTLMLGQREEAQPVTVRSFLSTMVYQAAGLAFLAWARHYPGASNVDKLSDEQFWVFGAYLRYYQLLIAFLHIRLMRAGILYAPGKLAVLYPAEDSSLGGLDNASVYSRIDRGSRATYGELSARDISTVMRYAQELVRIMQHGTSDILQEEDRTKIDRYEVDKHGERLVYESAVSVLRAALTQMEVEIEVLEVRVRRFPEWLVRIIHATRGPEWFSLWLARSFTRCCGKIGNKQGPLTHVPGTGIGLSSLRSKYHTSN